MEDGGEEPGEEASFQGFPIHVRPYTKGGNPPPPPPPIADAEETSFILCALCSDRSYVHGKGDADVMMPRPVIARHLCSLCKIGQIMSNHYIST